MQEPAMRHTTSREVWSPDGPRTHTESHHQPKRQYQGGRLQPEYRPAPVVGEEWGPPLQQHGPAPGAPQPRTRPLPVANRPSYNRPAAAPAPPADYQAHGPARTIFSAPHSARGRGHQRRSFTSTRGRGHHTHHAAIARYRPQAPATQATYRPQQPVMQVQSMVEYAPAPRAYRGAAGSAPPQPQEPGPAAAYGQGYAPGPSQRPTSPMPGHRRSVSPRPQGHLTYTQRRQSGVPPRHGDVALAKYAPQPQPQPVVSAPPRYASAPPRAPPHAHEYAQQPPPQPRSSPYKAGAEQPLGRAYPPPSHQRYQAPPPPGAAPQRRPYPQVAPRPSPPPKGPAPPRYALPIEQEQGGFSSSMPPPPSGPGIGRPRQSNLQYSRLPAQARAQGYEAAPHYTDNASPPPRQQQQRRQLMSPPYDTRASPPGRLASPPGRPESHEAQQGFTLGSPRVKQPVSPTLEGPMTVGVPRFDYGDHRGGGRGGGYAGRMGMGRGGMKGRGGGRGYAASTTNGHAAYGATNGHAAYHHGAPPPSSTALGPPSHAPASERGGPRGAHYGPPAMMPRNTHAPAAPVSKAQAQDHASPRQPAVTVPEGPAGGVGLSRVKQMLASNLLTAARSHSRGVQVQVQGGQRRHRGVVPDLMAELHGHHEDDEESQEEEEAQGGGAQGNSSGQHRQAVGGSVARGHEMLEGNSEHDLELLVPPRVEHQYEDTVRHMGQRSREKHRDFPGQDSHSHSHRKKRRSEDKDRGDSSSESERRLRRKKRRSSRRRNEGEQQLEVSASEVELIVSPGLEQEYEETVRQRERAKRREESRRKKKRERKDRDERRRDGHERKKHKKHHRREEEDVQEDEEEEDGNGSDSDTQAKRLFQELREKLIAEAAEDPAGLSIAPSPLVFGTDHPESITVGSETNGAPLEGGQAPEGRMEEEAAHNHVGTLDMEPRSPSDRAEGSQAAAEAQRTAVVAGTEGEMVVEQQVAVEVSEAASATGTGAAHAEGPAGGNGHVAVDRQQASGVVMQRQQCQAATPLTVSTTTTTTFMVRTTHVEKEREEPPPAVHKGAGGKASKLGVRAGGGAASHAGTGGHGSKPAPVDSHRREYYCEACGVEEACNSAYLVHLKSHQDCPVEGCDAHGSKAVIDTHFNFVHGKYSSAGYHTIVNHADPSTGPLHFRVLVGHDHYTGGEGDRLLHEWLEARRAKFPTAARVRDNREREERMQERLARRDVRTRTITVEEVASLQETEQHRRARQQRWWCEYCEAEFHSDEEFLNHLEGHESCSARGCFFFHALPSVLWAHYDYVHGRYARGRDTDGRVEVVRDGATYEICVSEDPGHVDMWLAERKQRFPKKKPEVVLPTASEADVEKAQAGSDQRVQEEGQAAGTGEAEDTDDDAI